MLLMAQVGDHSALGLTTVHKVSLTTIMAILAKLPAMTQRLKGTLTIRLAVPGRKEMTSNDLAVLVMTIAPTTCMKIAHPAVIEVGALARTTAAMVNNRMHTAMRVQRSTHAPY